MMASNEISEEWIKTEYLLHWLAWKDLFQELNTELSKKIYDMEAKDPRGRTPLHIAVSLGHADSASVLLHHGANANAVNAQNWTVLQEATSTADPEIVRLILKYRDNQRLSSWYVGIPELLQKINDTPDFYVEMTWEFTSWVPLVSRMCPSDTYKIYKSGSCVRIDTTLLGFDNTNWERGSRSYIFKGEGGNAVIMEVDHDKNEVYTEHLSLSLPQQISTVEPTDDVVAARLTAPLATTNIDTDKIAFERNKSGIPGWRSDKSEVIDNYDCKVFAATNVEIITKRRTEHLGHHDKEKISKTNKTPIESFLSVISERNSTTIKSAENNVTEAFNPSCITPQEYFNKDVTLENRDIGRPKEETSKVQKYKATISLCEQYPLSLQEQVIPIIDLMARSNAHFQKLRDFITLQIPAGFPVKIEIPLYHILNARVTFGNIFSSKSPVHGVHYSADESDEPFSIESHCFDIPEGYFNLGDGVYHDRLGCQDEQLLTFAVQQSLMETGTENDQVTFMEALSKSRPHHNLSYSKKEEIELQRAIEASMLGENSIDYDFINDVNAPGMLLNEGEDNELMLAIQLSQQDMEEAARQTQEEDEAIERILKLSLTEK